MVNNFDCLMSEKTMQRICFVYTKIRCASLATKIFKNIGILYKTIIDNLIDDINNARVLFEDNLCQFIVNLCQFMDIFGADATLCLGIAR